MSHCDATLSRLRAPLFLLASLAACTSPSGRPPSSAALAPPRPSASFERAECNGPWLVGDAHPALPLDDAARGRLWETLAPESLPPPFRECASGAPQTDIPETDFGLAPTSRPAPLTPPRGPGGWAAERPDLAALLLPAVQTNEESWHRGEGGYEHTFVTTHWLGAVGPGTLASFDRAARAAGLRLENVDRNGLAFTLRYATNGARLRLARISRTECALDLALTIAGDLRAEPAVAAAIAERPLARRIAERATLRGARRRGARFDFFFALDARGRGEDPLAHETLLPTRCPPTRSKGRDARHCSITSDARALIITDGARLDALDEPHDRFD